MTIFSKPVERIHGISVFGSSFNLGGLERILLREDLANKKVAVVSIAGASRKGKSFSLNFFVHYLEWLESGTGEFRIDEEMRLDRFKFRGGAQRHTEGISFYGKPFILKDRFGDDVVVLLMDSQGTWDHKSTVKQCTTIFALTTLLSSVQLFTNYAQLAKKESYGAPFQVKTVDRVNTSLQNLLFLLRDWPNSENFPYGIRGGTEYVESVLEVDDWQEAELQNVRKNISQSYESISGFLLPYPGEAIAVNNSKIHLGEVNPLFKEHLMELLAYLFQPGKIQAKMVSGREITCSELVFLFQSYVEVFSGDTLPEPKSILEATAEATNNAAAERAVGVYEKRINEVVKDHPNLSPEQFKEKHEMATKEALEVFDGPKIGGAEIERKYRRELLEKIQKRFDERRGIIEEKHRIRVEESRLEEERRKMEEERQRAEERMKKEKEEQEKKRKKMEEEHQKREEEQRKEEERLRREREEQERRRREQEEERRSRNEELSRKEEQLEREKMEAAENLKKQAEDLERRRKEDEERRRRDDEERRQREDENRERRERHFMEEQEKTRRQMQEDFHRIERRIEEAEEREYILERRRRQEEEELAAYREEVEIRRREEQPRREPPANEENPLEVIGGIIGIAANVLGSIFGGPRGFR